MALGEQACKKKKSSTRPWHNPRIGVTPFWMLPALVTPTCGSEWRSSSGRTRILAALCNLLRKALTPPSPHP